MYLQCLSTELLTKIFEYCDIAELRNLQQTCKRFYEIIKVATNLGNIQPLLVTNQLTLHMQRRSLKLLTLNEKISKSKNWEIGLYKEYVVLKERRKFMPKIVLTKDTLWISRGNNILGYKRNKIGISFTQANISKIPVPVASDICTFVYKDKCFISGQQNGSIFVKKLKEEFICLQNAHDSDVDSVDLSTNRFVSGSKSGCLKLWNLETCKPVYSWHDVNDRIWSVSLSKACDLIGVGTAANKNNSPLYVYDVNSCKVIHELGEDLPPGAGLLQLKWEAQNILLSCGYDSKVHKWDLRCNICVQSWEDPFYLPVYCFDTDNYCTLLTGIASHGRTVLWDMRMKSYIQMYFMESCTKLSQSSPVYSLAFDVDHLFAATDYNLNILNFSVKTGVAQNYSKTLLRFLK